jgi:hypothetical protein
VVVQIVESRYLRHYKGFVNIVSLRE